MTKAFVLAAGMGTRLRPLTYNLPKPLLPVQRKTGLFYVLEHLKSAGIKTVIINLHYLPEKITRILGDGSRFNLRIKYSYEKQILDTGGGLKKVEYFLKDGAFIMYNCDVICNVDLNKMMAYHRESGNKVTLLAGEDSHPRCLVVNGKGRVKGFTGAGGERGNYVFCGIHIIEPSIFGFIAPGKPVSIIDVYRNMIGKGVPIGIFRVRGSFWKEIGNMESYRAINEKDGLAGYDDGQRE